MTGSTLDVVGVGNAIVDVLANSDDAFLDKHNIIKGGMTLIEEPEAAAIYGAMAAGVEVSGGSAANTIACLGSLGGNGGFIGKVADDELGRIFGHDLKSLGVAFDTEPLSDGPGTGRCLVNVTPDAQRSMSTFLGAACHVSDADFDADFVASAAITYFEGYLFEFDVPRAAFVKACDLAHAAGRKTALTLSDPGCVDRHRPAFESFINDHVDILFANEDEANALFGSGNIEEAARSACELVAVTKSEKGSVLILRDGDSVTVDAIKPSTLVDTTGAGDAYAAGVLFGLSRGSSLETSGKLGSLAASEVISHFGARPQTSLKDLATQHGLL